VSTGGRASANIGGRGRSPCQKPTKKPGYAGGPRLGSGGLIGDDDKVRFVRHGRLRVAEQLRTWGLLGQPIPA
jgi:hypothetical protein